MSSQDKKDSNGEEVKTVQDGIFNTFMLELDCQSTDDFKDVKDDTVKLSMKHQSLIFRSSFLGNLCLTSFVNSIEDVPDPIEFPICEYTPVQRLYHKGTVGPWEYPRCDIQMYGVAYYYNIDSKSALDIRQLIGSDKLQPYEPFDKSEWTHVDDLYNTYLNLLHKCSGHIALTNGMKVIAGIKWPTNYSNNVSTCFFVCKNGIMSVKAHYHGEGARFIDEKQYNKEFVVSREYKPIKTKGIPRRPNTIRDHHIITRYLFSGLKRELLNNGFLLPRQVQCRDLIINSIAMIGSNIDKKIVLLIIQYIDESIPDSYESPPSAPIFPRQH